MSAKLKLPTKIPKMSKTNACRNKQKDKEKLEVFLKTFTSPIMYSSKYINFFYLGKRLNKNDKLFLKK